LYLAIDGQEIAHYPSEFKCTIMDLDNAETTKRTADGQLTRERIAVKRQIELRFNAMTWDKLSAILTALKPKFVQITYPDPESGQQETRTFYVSDRESAIAIERGGTYYWSTGFTLTEK
jgi:hypothetical protein